MFKTIPFQYDEELKREIDLRGYSYITFKNYRSHLRRISEYIGKDISSVTTNEAKQYLYHLHVDLKRCPQCINVCRAAFLFFSQCVMGRNISPYSLPKQKVIQKLPDILPPERILAVFDVLMLKHRAILSLCYGSGLRISEVLSLHISDIDSKGMKVFVRNGKGGRQRYSILSEYSLKTLREYFRAHRPQGVYLFPKRGNPGRHLSPQFVQTQFATTYKQLFPVDKDKRITIHTLRHCFATHLLDSDTDLRTIQILLGHKSITSTCIYTHLTKRHFSQLVSPLDQNGG